MSNAKESAVSKVLFCDLGRNLKPHQAQLRDAAARVLESAHFIGGDEVKALEHEMAAQMGLPEVCAVGCGTSAIYAALKCLGIGPGDEVITTVHTAIPTAEAICLTGAKVVFCDILGSGRYNIDPAEIKLKMTAQTAAIVVVHLYGIPADMTPILEIARARGLFVIEDCAQAQGAKYGGQWVGTLGDVGTYSFFPSKNLGGFGDGGAVVARDPGLLKRIRMFANHGREEKYTHEFIGTNSRLDALQAALLRVILPQLGPWNARRREIVRWYAEGLANVPDLVLPVTPERTEPAPHLFVVVAPDRDKLAAHLRIQGVGTALHYPMSLNLQPAFAHLRMRPGTFPRAEHACSHMLSLPLFPTITRAEVDHVCAQVREFYRVP